jgi:hypothetical protein
MRHTKKMATEFQDNASSYAELIYDGAQAFLAPDFIIRKRSQSGGLSLSSFSILTLYRGVGLLASPAPAYDGYPVTVIMKQIITPISNICFVGNTPIVCDQGSIPIRSIQPDIHTIFNKKIVAITQTITDDKYLVCFEKDALGKNLPAKKTIITPHHKIMYKGKLVMAGYFIDHFKGVSKVPYSGEVLYNVLMEKHELMIVNNMLTETLHPKNVIAKLYNNPLITECVKKAMIETMNDCWINKKTSSYKKLVSRL